MEAVLVPSELGKAPADVLEGYVQARIEQILSAFSHALASNIPGLSSDVVSASRNTALAAVPPPEYAVARRQLQLVFRHDCMALGCLDPQCALCLHNPCRRCTVNFDRKYLVSDQLKARCGAPIRMELVDRITGQIVEESVPELKLEMIVLDGQLYDAKSLELSKTQGEGATLSDSELEACALLLNKKKNMPLLVCGAGGMNLNDGRVVVPMPIGNRVPLPELHISDSSEAILLGRKPPFRLLVRPHVQPGSPQHENIHHAVSEGFVVATRRTRTAGKVDIPTMDDPVGKLEHMGKETVKKLQDIQAAAQQVGIEIEIPENSVQKVGDFKALALRAEQDGHLRQRLQHVLKLSREKWEEARDHAMRAVVADSRMRAWYADREAAQMGLLFACRLGSVELERPVALLQTRLLDDGRPKTEATLMDDLLPMQRELVAQMQQEAAHSWWQQGHTGWAIFPVDTDHFLQTGSLEGPPMLPQQLAGSAPQLMLLPGVAPLSPRMLGSDPGALMGPGAMQMPGQIPGMSISGGGGPMGATGPGGSMGPWGTPMQGMQAMHQQGAGQVGDGGAARPPVNPFAAVAGVATAALNAAGGTPGSGANNLPQRHSSGTCPMPMQSPAPMATEPDPVSVCSGSRSGRSSSGGGAAPPDMPPPGSLLNVKRQLEPMEVPSPTGNHEQQWRPFPSAAWSGPASRSTLAPTSRFAPPVGSAAPVDPANAAPQPGNLPPPLGNHSSHPSPLPSPRNTAQPNPFLSVQHHAAGAGSALEHAANGAPVGQAVPNGHPLTVGISKSDPALGLSPPAPTPLPFGQACPAAVESPVYGSMSPQHQQQQQQGSAPAMSQVQVPAGPANATPAGLAAQASSLTAAAAAAAAAVMNQVLRDASRPSSQTTSRSHGPSSSDAPPPDGSAASDYILPMTSSDLAGIMPDNMDTSFSMGRAGSLFSAGGPGIGPAFIPSLLQGGIPSLNTSALMDLSEAMVTDGGHQRLPLHLPAHMALLQSQGSALDHMQSIEQALPGVS